MYGCERGEREVSVQREGGKEVGTEGGREGSKEEGRKLVDSSAV